MSNCGGNRAFVDARHSHIRVLRVGPNVKPADFGQISGRNADQSIRKIQEAISVAIEVFDFSAALLSLPFRFKLFVRFNKLCFDLF